MYIEHSQRFGGQSVHFKNNRRTGGWPRFNARGSNRFASADTGVLQFLGRRDYGAQWTGRLRRPVRGPELGLQLSISPILDHDTIGIDEQQGWEDTDAV